MKGRVLGIDFGLKRVGIAVCDPDRSMVFPRPVLRVSSSDQVYAQVKKICEEEHVTALVVGLPYDDLHVENEQTARVRTFGQKLSDECCLPVFFEDEKYTTAQAELLLDGSGFDFREKKLSRDSVAAMLILQSFIERV
jgi:putative Holliday junction resolvase